MAATLKSIQNEILELCKNTDALLLKTHLILKEIEKDLEIAKNLKPLVRKKSNMFIGNASIYFGANNIGLNIEKNMRNELFFIIRAANGHHYDPAFIKQKIRPILEILEAHCNERIIHGKMGRSAKSEFNYLRGNINESNKEQFVGYINKYGECLRNFRTAINLLNKLLQIVG